jgi:predicted O-methyltransferase YrrM
VFNRLAPVRGFRTIASDVRRSWPQLTIDEVFASLDHPKNCGLLVAMQKRDEFRQLLHLYSRMRPARVMEIGTAKGGSLFAFAELAGPGATIVSVDLPTGRFGGGGFWPASRWRMYAKFAHPSQRLVLIRGDSHAPEILQKVKTALAGAPLDFLFIDGDHSYDGVRLDYETYGPLVRAGGVIAFHDIVGTTPERVGGVPRFWQEIREGRNVIQFVDSPHQDGYGIGVLYKSFL